MKKLKGMLLALGLSTAIVIPITLGIYFFGGLQKTAKTTATTETSETTESTKTTGSTKATEATSSSSEKKTASEDEKDPVEKLMSQMTLEEKVGQLFLARVPKEKQLEDLKNYHLGGYLLFGKDVSGLTVKELQEKTQSFRDAAKFPLLLGADEEGGTVSRVSGNKELVTTPFKSPQELYALGKWEKITSDTLNKAKLLTSFGLNTGLFPVADVATEKNAFIYDRTIGLDATGTSDYVTTVVKALEKAQFGSTLKHFPGYGNNSDSHTEIVTDNRPLKELEENDFKPFIAGIKAGADSILVSHNIVTAIDNKNPASISPKVHDILRKNLNFKGVIMTDDMDMAGLSDFISQEDAGLAALKAGNDLILSSTYSQQIPKIVAAVKKGDYSEEDLDTSVKRVLTWKKDLGLLEK